MTHSSLSCKLFARTPEATDNALMPGLRKRSVLLAGHATSIALEPEFWAVLEEMARAGGVSLVAVIVGIDASRDGRALASACRVAALAYAGKG